MIEELIRTFVAWALIFPALFAAGSFVRPLIKVKDQVLEVVLVGALGMIILSYGVVFLHILRLLNPTSIWILLSLLIVLKFRFLWPWFQETGKLLSREYFRPSHSKTGYVVGGVLLFAILGLALGTLSPEIGGDALCYHLNLPKVFLEQGSLTPFEYDENAFFPLLMNNLYLVGLATGGVFTAKLFHFFCGILLLIAVERSILKATKNHLLALMITLVVFLTPGIYNQLSTTYIDVALTLFTFLSVLVLHRALQDSDLKMIGVSGALMGAALATKYLALVSILALLIYWGFLLLQKREWKPWLQQIWIWGIGILIVSGYWLGRNWMETGNPFYPYLGSVFGQVQRPPADYIGTMGKGTGPFAFLTLFWNMFRDPSAFGAFSNRIGGFYFLLFPFLFLGLVFEKKHRIHALFTLSFLLLWFYMAQADRWLYPVLPSFAVAAALGLHYVGQRLWPHRQKVIPAVAKGVGLLLLLVYLAGGIYHYRYAYRLFTGQWAPGAYLTALERTYPIATWINQNLPQDAKILIDAEPSKFYFDRPLIQNKVLKWRTKYDKKSWSHKRLEEFIVKLGVTHILMSHPVDEPELYQKDLLYAFVTQHLGEPLHVMESQNIRDARHRYVVYEVPGRSIDS